MIRVGRELAERRVGLSVSTRSQIVLGCLAPGVTL